MAEYRLMRREFFNALTKYVIQTRSEKGPWMDYEESYDKYTAIYNLYELREGGVKSEEEIHVP